MMDDRAAQCRRKMSGLSKVNYFGYWLLRHVSRNHGRVQYFRSLPEHFPDFHHFAFAALGRPFAAAAAADEAADEELAHTQSRSFPARTTFSRFRSDFLRLRLEPRQFLILPRFDFTVLLFSETEIGLKIELIS
jgi:hypothetical protein